MSDTNVAPGGGTDTIVSVPVVTPAAADKTPISASEAGRQLSAFRRKQEAQPQEPAAPAEAAAEELAETPTDDQPQADPVETTPEPEPAEPLIEPPRSWTK